MVKKHSTVAWLEDNTIMHIETEFGIVNIRCGLTNTDGDSVTSIEILPDAGVTLEGQGNNKLIKKGDTQ